MKRRIACVAVLVLLMCTQVYAANPTLLDMRTKLLKESADIKSLLVKSTDAVLVSSLWDACVLTMTQLDAYFSLMGMFTTIRKDAQVQSAVDYMIGWVREIKRSNDLNIKSMSTILEGLEAATAKKLDVLKTYYRELNSQLASEERKLNSLKAALKK